jgi:sporulation protein, YlmC/YmxH family
MDCRLSDLRDREVVNVSTGCRLGFVSDAIFSLPEGKISALIVPGPARLFGLLGREDDYVLPWEAVTQMGNDIILIDGKANIRRARRDRDGTGIF